MYDLTRIDYLILECVGKHEPISRDALARRLSGKVDSLDYRLDTLSQPEYVNGRIPRKNSSYLTQKYGEVDGYGGTQPLGIYSLTGLGRKTIQDHRESLKIEHNAAWRSWIQWGVPIAISLFSLLNSIFRWIEVPR